MKTCLHAYLELETEQRRQIRAPDRDDKLKCFPKALWSASQPLTPFLDFTPSGNQVSLCKSADAFAFEEDSSSDGLSPDQTRSEDPQGSAGSPADSKASETPLAGPALGAVQVNKPHLSPSCLCGPQGTLPPLVSRRDPGTSLDGASDGCLFLPDPVLGIGGGGGAKPPENTE